MASFVADDHEEAMQPLKQLADSGESTRPSDTAFWTPRRMAVAFVAVATAGCATVGGFRMTRGRHATTTLADLSSSEFLLGTHTHASTAPNQELCCSSGAFDLSSCCAGMQQGVTATQTVPDSELNGGGCSGTITCTGTEANSSSPWTCDCPSDVFSAGEGSSASDETHADEDDDKDSNCFPGDATVFVYGVGAVRMDRLQPFAEVLVQRGSTVVYEPAIGFLHVVHPVANRLYDIKVVNHSTGQFKASANHLVFTTVNGVRTSKMVKDLQVGDELIAVDMVSGGVKKSVVAFVGNSVASSLYAPLTQSGSIVVDGVVASVYASPSTAKQLSHSVAHALFFPVRLVHWLGLSWLLASFSNQRVEGTRVHDMHTFAKFLRHDLRLDKFLLYSK